jgi:hypothetical protein
MRGCSETVCQRASPATLARRRRILAGSACSASAEIPPREGLKCRKNAAKVLAEDAQYRLKPFASASRKTGSPSVKGCCFERFSPWDDLADLVLRRRRTLTAVATFAIALMLTIEVGVAIAFAASWFTWRQVGESAPSDRHDSAPVSAPLDDRSGLVEGRLLMVRAQSSRVLA